jgi:hypothetical protein
MVLVCGVSSLLDLSVLLLSLVYLDVLDSVVVVVLRMPNISIWFCGTSLLIVLSVLLLPPVALESRIRWCGGSGRISGLCYGPLSP